jgi:hypothetical protein
VLAEDAAIHPTHPTNFHNFPKDPLLQTVFSSVPRFLLFLWFGVAVCAAAPLRVAVFALEFQSLSEKFVAAQLKP